MSSKLFQPIKLGDIQLSTGLRADAKDVLLVPLVKEYYSQRATEPGTLLISEGTVIQQRAGGYNNVPGIWSNEQINAWKEARICASRAADPDVLHSEGPSYPYVSASDIPMLSGTPSQAQDTPRPLTLEEIKEYMEYYATAAKNAVHKAEFDGVEIHGANGYPIEQFLKKSTYGTYGGSSENRARFALEVIDAVVGAVGPGKTGFGESYYTLICQILPDIGARDPIPTYSHLVKAHPTLAYIHVVDPRVDGITDIENVGNHSNEFIREIWTEGTDNEINGRRLISAGNFDLETGTKLADTRGDLVAYRRRFISNVPLRGRLF
ncbi:hypothetical protein V5O48_013908 [Marasmius crinis-equi]|uniref:NADH:flavin oxidoreductase/NADH oxidase N-terminal domain-containing protein n=1 Tax=Marasmius crinis-equi TaxID=585013 RepID=A0ABR3EYS2_9AGAR